MNKLLLLIIPCLMLFSCSKQPELLNISEFEGRFNANTFNAIELNVLNRPEFKTQDKGYSAMYTMTYGQLMVSADEKGGVKGVVMSVGDATDEEGQFEVLLYINSLLKSLDPKLNTEDAGDELFNLLMDGLENEISDSKQIGDYLVKFVSNEGSAPFLLVEHISVANND